MPVEVDSPPFRITVSEKLYEAYKKEGDFEEALKYHEMAKQVSDSLTEAQQNEQLALAETELGLRQQQKINQLLQERQQQQEARITTQNWLIGMSVFVIIVILISTVVLYRSNRERQRINRELEELNKVKNKMMAIIAHDLRSPMTSMQGIFYLLKDEDLQMEEIREIASNLEVTVQQNINMMDNLLSWANSQMRGLEIDVESVSAFDIVEEIFENCSFQAEHKSLKLVNNVDPKLTVKADVNLFKLIIRNLVNNAIKFSHEGDTVTVSAEEVSEEVVFKVKDTGIGIPKDQQDSIFSFQGHSRSGTNNENGSGLGLQLCKEFVEKQNGTIDLESTEGEGSTFYVSLPKG
ncbi:HAMP domain-containing sensor histidine kinase [Fodinibius sp.]|uniref:sensor histidine kinase n=1 Tax=Fodinibius sp. TaxID=1872440 RepID=UPI002ACD496D|nr:HAMP domain-containing sensor histidine kinase [Fodinibius sp.]MDZ7659611.1 HAMP domain-containing sensor histidine kinase [Fodinibius sp.]